MAEPQIVVTVHGIFTEGRWQEEVAPVLWPHFTPRSKKYRSYRYLGPLDLLFHPWILFPGLVVWVLGTFAFGFWTGWPSILILLAVMGLAMWMAASRLDKTVRTFIKNAEQELLSGRVHFIGHSLGSYILCCGLQDEETWYADRVILAGCVVTSAFPWATVLPKKAAAIRNEVAKRDFVAILASWLKWRHSRFGRAGQAGFDVGSGVHTLAAPDLKCESAECSAAVHNFVSKKKGHSDVLRVTYVKNYWLPFLWEFGADEFRSFLDNCLALKKEVNKMGEVGAAPTSGPFFDLAVAFLARKWGWARGKEGDKTIEQYLAGMDRAVKSEDRVWLVMGICTVVSEAERALSNKIALWREDEKARQSYKSAAHDEKIKPLNPQVAVLRAHAGL